MYLVKIKSGDKICETAEEIKMFKKSEVIKIYSLLEVDYDDIVSTGDVRDCIYKYLKGKQEDKDNVIVWVSEELGIKKAEVSKVITAMKKEKIVYQVIDLGNHIGIN